ncbi:hypothetical protein FSP39_022055 [Pinctada imbricata]|uniref:DDE Tnp4 domain-containing protein n=1 Tax=Pinctada imbricata TaxID=66713 RepID=A0AA88YR47_PINIB|nr:hypothetical protein FSP39_022055 [Pinctada imbricata]
MGNRCRLRTAICHVNSRRCGYPGLCAHRVPHNTISMMIPDVCQAIIFEYGDEVIACPRTQEEWRKVAKEFGTRWNFHHALGAIDGKHIAIKAPKNSGSLYYNYKGFFSIVMLAVVDADYKFLWVDVGANGSASDTQVFTFCELKQAIDNSEMNFPSPEPLPHDNEDMPYFLVGDDAFALRTWMMKPFSKRNLSPDERIFNYRLSRSRRVVVNAFGILANRFQCLLTTMRQKPEPVQIIALACCCLHNLMRIRYSGIQSAILDQSDGNDNIIPGEWRNGAVMHDLGNNQRGNVASRAAQQQRVSQGVLQLIRW